MKEKISALHSKYIIDGVSRRLTPAEMLDDCLARREGNQTCGEGGFEPVVDESTDPTPSLKVFGTKDIQEYLSKVVSLIGEPRPFPAAYPEPYTKGQIAKALLDAIWLKGHFKLNDLTIAAKWRWNRRPLGNMAAFYASASDGRLRRWSGNMPERLFLHRKPAPLPGLVQGRAAEKDEDPEDDDENIFIPGDAPFGSEHPVIGRRRAVPDKLQDESGSWIIYVPFDTCGFRLGNSLLCDALGQNGDKYPEVGDADYFIDCHEVVREFVEDRVLLSAATVCDGGLLTALKLMCSGNIGADIDISGIMNAYGETKSVRVLFSEVPGAIIQIKDSDYDYIDAEFLLQDIAYYPIGHTVTGSGEVNVKAGGSNGISSILQSLLNSQASEGED